MPRITYLFPNKLEEAIMESLRQERVISVDKVVEVCKQDRKATVATFSARTDVEVMVLNGKQVFRYSGEDTPDSDMIVELLAESDDSLECEKIIEEEEEEDGHYHE
jgi:phosphosulfolactate phosphohydrolase-like enzyme